MTIINNKRILIIVNRRYEGKARTMKVTTFSINTTDGKRYGLKNAKTGDVLHCATAKYKTKRGAINYAIKRGFEIA